MSDVAFELERCEVKDDRLVLSGRWNGVRGMRFVRPTLLVDGDRVLATLEHKPWDPGGESGVGAFPGRGAEVAPSTLELSVAPTTAVPLWGAGVRDRVRGGGRAAVELVREQVAGPREPRRPAREDEPRAREAA